MIFALAKYGLRAQMTMLIVEQEGFVPFQARVLRFQAVHVEIEPQTIFIYTRSTQF